MVYNFFYFYPSWQDCIEKWDKIMGILNNEEQKEREDKDE